MKQRTASLKTVLVVEDTPSVAEIYKHYLDQAGLPADCVETGAAALEMLARGSYRVVLLDVNLPDMDGLEVMAEIVSRDLPVSVVVVTASGSVKLAVNAMRGGAYDFLVKPVSPERLVTTVRNAQERSSLRAQVDDLTLGDGDRFYGFVGSSLPMRSIYRMIESVARSRASVFLTGESGTGKEVCAEAIHLAGPRRDKPFVALNCAAIPSNLIESEIFGHAKGAFTGATADREGAARRADGGTLFLDEVCEMDAALQSKLLRFLQSGRIQPVGSDRAEPVDVRFICATNRDPMVEVEAGRFREDLYYRLHVLPIHLPPLRERGADVLEIGKDFLTQVAREEGCRFNGFTDAAEDLMLLYGWPGNVRELQNVIRNVVVLNDGELVTDDMLRPVLGGDVRPDAGERIVARPAARSPIQETAGGSVRVPLGQSLADIEKLVIEATIAACGGSLPRAAKVLKVSPSTLYRKRETWNVEENDPDGVAGSSDDPANKQYSSCG